MSGCDLVDEMRGGAKLPAPKPGKGGGVDLLLVLIAIVALGAAAYFGGSKWLGGTPFGSVTPPQGTSGPLLTAARTPGAEDRWTDADTARCTARARAAADVPLPAAFTLANRAVTPGFAGLTTMLECQMTTKVVRFCDSGEKAKLVTAVNDYLARTDIVVAAMGIEGAPMAVMGHFFGEEAAAGSTIYEMEHDATLAFMQIYQTRIAAALKSLARNGLVAPSDFAGFMGLGVPENVKALFGAIQQERSLCA